jgi:hypothetical protein
VVTGYVKRSDGKSTVFIDKRAYPARDPRMQGAIEPRLIQRYEPLPPPAPPAPPAKVPSEEAKATKQPIAPTAIPPTKKAKTED